MPTEDERRGGLAPDEPNQDQPARDDLIDPEDIGPEDREGEPLEPPDEEEVGLLPPSEELPESQGDDVLDAQRQAEDATTRRRLSDEEAEGPDR